MTHPTYVGLAARLFYLLALGAAAWHSARFSYANWLLQTNTLPSVRRATAVAPEDAEARAALSRLLRDGEPDAAKAQLEEAVHRNRWDSQSLIELALLVERRGDRERAESLLREAARVDALYFPRWSLANFYLRQGDEENFWKWARLAIGISARQNLPSLFQLAARVAGSDRNAVELLRLKGPEALGDYLRFAIAAGRATEMKQLIRALPAEQDRPAVSLACEYLVRTGRAADAAEACPPGLFEWQLPRVDGVKAERTRDPAGLRIQLDSQRPERCELAGRYVAASGPGDVIVTAGVLTQGLPAESGVRWELFDPVSGSQVGTSPVWLSGENWTAVTSAVRVKSRTNGLRLALTYTRAAGTVRTDGAVSVRDVRVTGGRR